MTTREDASPKCSICLRDHISQKAVITKCGHQFCYPCLLQWTDTRRNINVGPSCPNCRTLYDETDIKTDDDVYRRNAGSEPSDENAELFQQEARSHERDARHERVLSVQPFGLRRRTGFRCQE